MTPEPRRWTIKRGITVDVIYGPYTGDEEVDVEEVLSRGGEPMVEALRQIAAKGDHVVTAPDGVPSIIVVENREVEECAAIARAALSGGGEAEGEGHGDE